MTTPETDRAAPEGEGPCYLYGVTTSEVDPDALADLAGIGPRGPVLVEHAGLVAVVEVLDDEAQASGRAGLMAHYRVLNAVAAHAAVLPMQFGTLLADAGDVGPSVLGPRQDELASALAALAGHVQLVVKARYVQEAVLAEVVAEDPRIRDLRERTREVSEEAGYHLRIQLGELVAQAVEAKRAADREHLVASLQPHAVDWSVRDGSGIEGLADVSLLLREEQRPALEEALSVLARSAAERVTIQLIGPMAPFEFVTGG